jgi:tetratricopeptide (TPR) repeat protein
MSLRHPLNVFARTAAVIAVATVCAIQLSIAAEEDKGPPAQLPQALPEGHRSLVPPTGTESGPAAPANTPQRPQRITRQSKAAFLTTLYDQLKQSQSEEGAELVAKAIERVWRQSGSDTADLLMERAGIAIQAKDMNLALELLSSLVEIAPDYAEGWNQLATVYFLQEDYDRAMRGLRHVLALEPQHYKAIEGLSLILREMGDKKGALRATRRALTIYPHLKSAQQVQEELVRDVEGQGI